MNFEIKVDLNKTVRLGELSPFKEVLFRFPETSRCPLDECRISCSSPSIAMSHFMENPDNLMKHYAENHPNVALPQMKSVDTHLNRHEETTNEDVHSRGNTVEDTNVITLTGGGRVTKFPFPKNQLKCPVLRCPAEFESSQATHQHYEETHAKTSIFCELCRKPIVCYKSAKSFIRHFELMHENSPIPYGLDNKHVKHKTISNETAVKARNRRLIASRRHIFRMRCNFFKLRQTYKYRLIKKTLKKNMKESDTYEDVVELHGCGYVTHWTITENYGNRCPTCLKYFSNRSVLITHYKTSHSNRAIFCSICKKPISTSSGRTNYEQHYCRMHPRIRIPFDFHNDTSSARESLMRKKQTRRNPKWCELCQKEVVMLRRHMKEIHSGEKFVCPFERCDFVAKRKSKVKHHFNKTHCGSAESTDIQFRRSKRHSRDESPSHDNLSSSDDEETEDETEDEDQWAKRMNPPHRRIHPVERDNRVSGGDHLNLKVHETASSNETFAASTDTFQTVQNSIGSINEQTELPINDEPLNLSMKKLNPEPVYVMDSDEEKFATILDSDDDEKFNVNDYKLEESKIC